MKLYDHSVELDLKLKAMQFEDSKIELVAKADNFVDILNEASACLASVVRLKARISTTSSPPVDGKSVSAAIRAFRAGLSTHGQKAFQQQPAAKLIEVAKDLRVRCNRWAATQWKSLIEEYVPLLDAAQSGQLSGSSVHRRRAERLATRIVMLQRQNPITDENKVVAELCGGDVDASWADELRALADQLRHELILLKKEHDALTPEVQTALRSASSEEGLSLEDLTADLLGMLHAAGVAGDLVVRRR
ncbi:hypothetical protein MYP14_23425 [Rhodococcus pyridinivorans]|uniref:hypothetical protein n=1 Tax=Rhodococcus pyridinivorans TaxID=103816 RepID=UPI001FFF0A5F|nr:hypothetical protein [Rhodococcus pyridinivorans]UPK63611.1 hypothetical protein MYP14_23425 [Rhodococcus pyridinivorans]